METRESKTGREREMANRKRLWEMTREDRVLGSGKVPWQKNPSQHRGTLVEHGGRREIGGIWRVGENQFKVCRLKDFSRGVIESELPGTFKGSDFEKAGQLELSATRIQQFWQFKKQPG